MQEVNIMAAINVTTENFDKAVLNGAGTNLVDFWASWCGPCRMLSPVVEQVADENPDLHVFKVNVDDEPEIAERYGIQSIPTLIVFRGGQEVNRSVGVVPKAKILQLVK